MSIAAGSRPIWQKEHLAVSSRWKASIYQGHVLAGNSDAAWGLRQQGHTFQFALAKTAGAGRMRNQVSLGGFGHVRGRASNYHNIHTCEMCWQ